MNYYLIDLVRDRYEFHDLRRRVIELSARWSAHQTIIEDTELGRALNQDLRKTKDLAPVISSPKFSKEARFIAQSARFESGQVFVPRDAPWLGAWMNEILAFPNGKHDDQVDSTSQALASLTRSSNLGRELPHRNPPRTFERPVGTLRRKGAK